MDGLTFGGPREYSILPTIAYSTFLSLTSSSRKLTAQTNSNGDKVYHNQTISVKAKLTNYPTVTTTGTFIIEIINCQVVGLTNVSPVADQFYNVYTPMITYSWVAFTMTPACGYTLDYTRRFKDLVAGTYTAIDATTPYVADKAAATATSGSFETSTNDPTKVGVYHIAVEGIVKITDMANPYRVE